MKNFLTGFLSILVCVVIFCVYANAEQTFSTLTLTPGTAGVNWTVPDKTSEIMIESQSTDATNWVDISMFQNAGLNWTNMYRIQPGSVFKLSGVWSKGNQIGIKGGLAATVVEITYAQSN